MSRQRNKPSNTMNNQGNKEVLKGNEKFPENKLNDMEIPVVKDRESRLLL